MDEFSQERVRKLQAALDVFHRDDYRPIGVALIDPDWVDPTPWPLRDHEREIALMDPPPSCALGRLYFEADRAGTLFSNSLGEYPDYDDDMTAEERREAWVAEALHQSHIFEELNEAVEEVFGLRSDDRDLLTRVNDAASFDILGVNGAAYDEYDDAVMSYRIATTRQVIQDLIDREKDVQPGVNV